MVRCPMALSKSVTTSSRHMKSMALLAALSESTLKQLSTAARGLKAGAHASRTSAGAGSVGTGFTGATAGAPAGATARAAAGALAGAGSMPPPPSASTSTALHVTTDTPSHIPRHVLKLVASALDDYCRVNGVDSRTLTHGTKGTQSVVLELRTFASLSTVSSSHLTEAVEALLGLDGAAGC